MDLEQWKQISGPLFAAFPQTNVSAETLAVYFADLAEFDARDVDAACEFLRRNTGPFLPSIEAVRSQVRLEQTVREEWSAAPDCTGIAELPAAERDKLLERNDGSNLAAEVRALIEKVSAEP